jgi:hypothetical protein
MRLFQHVPQFMQLDFANSPNSQLPSKYEQSKFASFKVHSVAV